MGAVLDKTTPTGHAHQTAQSEWRCSLCEDKGDIDVITVPYVFRYLVAELAAMNINVQLPVS